MSAILSPILTTPKRRTLDRAKRYDCGKAGQLTAQEIRQRTGLKLETVYGRITAGETGAALLRPLRGRLVPREPRTPGMVIACKLAQAFPDRIPTTREVRKVHPMCTTSAQRWIAAYRAARGQEP